MSSTLIPSSNIHKNKSIVHAHLNHATNPFLLFSDKHEKDKEKEKEKEKDLTPLLLLQNIQNIQNIQTKKLITISPGGIQGFYLAGVCSYLKEHYVLDDYNFSGASAGAWNALFMTYKGNTTDFIYKLLDTKSFENVKSIYEVECAIKNEILSKYNTEDFDLHRLFIGITSLQQCKFKLHILNDFDDLEDALNACIASSHIPFITGGLTHVYKNMYTFDGGFSKNPYAKSIDPPILHITPSMFLSEKEKKKINIWSFIQSKKKDELKKLLEKGYHDARTNHIRL